MKNGSRIAKVAIIIALIMALGITVVFAASGRDGARKPGAEGNRLRGNPVVENNDKPDAPDNDAVPNRPGAFGRLRRRNMRLNKLNKLNKKLEEIGLPPINLKEEQNAELKERADKYGISCFKMLLIERALMLKPELSEEELAGKTIKEILEILFGEDFFNPEVIKERLKDKASKLQEWLEQHPEVQKRVEQRKEKLAEFKTKLQEYLQENPDVKEWFKQNRPQI